MLISFDITLNLECRIFLVIFFNCSYSEHTKNLLVECAASHLKHKKFTTSFGARLTSSSGRILLQSVPGWSLTISSFPRQLLVYKFSY